MAITLLLEHICIDFTSQTQCFLSGKSISIDRKELEGFF